jgi:hypothetical protein
MHTEPTRRSAGGGGATDLPPEVAEQILRAVRHVKYGSVEVVIHDARVVQVERREKIRVSPAKPPGEVCPD